MKIAVIGKGNIGGTLGSKWRAAGHDVVFGARDGRAKAPAGMVIAAVNRIGAPDRDRPDAAAAVVRAGQAERRRPQGRAAHRALTPVRGIGDALDGADVVLLVIPSRA